MSDRTRLTRLREKASDERARLDALLDEALVAHVGVTADHGPLVVPIAFARDGDRLLVHGSTGSPWLRTLADGASACVTVTAVDGLVVARSAFESSMHYRSAVIFGTFTPVPDPERALDLLTERLLPGRTAEVRRPNARELAATQVLGLPLEEWSLKLSDDWPDDPPDDIAGPAWAGVVPLRTVAATARPAPDLRAGIAVPASVRDLSPDR